MAKVFTFVTEPTPTYARQYINRHNIKPEYLVTFQWIDNNHTLIGYWKNEPVSHETLPDRIRDYYPSLNEVELKKSYCCCGSYYYYTKPNGDIVGGFDGNFYVVDPDTKANKYLETAK